MGSKVLASLASVFSFGVFRCRILKNEKSTYLCQSPKIKNLKTLSWKILIENPLWLYWKLWICPLLQWLNNIWPCSSVSLCTKFEVSNFYHAKVREGGGSKNFKRRSCEPDPVLDSHLDQSKNLTSCCLSQSLPLHKVCGTLNYTYFTLPCRELGLMRLALYLVDWPTIVLQCFTLLVGPEKKIVPDMTYNVFSGTLNPTLLLAEHSSTTLWGNLI